MAERRVVQAKDAFAVTLKGVPVVVSPGDRYYSDDPIVKGREALFEELDVQSSLSDRRAASLASPLGSAVETATADPGLRRRRTRPTHSSEV